jgi:RHS repeat-associated protein
MPDGTWSRRDTTYNSNGQKQSVSELEATPTHYTSFLYDSLGREQTVTPPDGVQHSVTYAYTGVRQRSRIQTIATDGDYHDNQHPHPTETPSTTTETYDGLGRLTEVSEPSGENGALVTTEYTYDVANRLVSANSASGQQLRTFTYDNRGFLLQEVQPEVSTFYSGYDARGHAGKEARGTSNGTGLQYEFDVAERVKRVIEIRETGLTRPLKEFNYIEGSTIKGRLISATRHNYLDTGDRSAVDADIYDAAGRISRRDTTLSSGEHIFATYAYDPTGAVASIGYPRCSSPGCSEPTGAFSVAYQYTNGFLTKVPGFADNCCGRPTTDPITYHPNGLLHQLQYTNGVVLTQESDPSGIARSSSIQHSNLQLFGDCSSVTIVEQPRSAGAPAALHILVNYLAGAAYQWYVGESGDVSHPVSGATADTLSMSPSASTKYWVAVTTGCMTLYSDAAMVYVGSTSNGSASGHPKNDFDGDGKSDLLWRDSAGDIAVWLMNGRAVSVYGTVATLVDQQWKIVGAGDFSGDGKWDFLWRHAVTGDVAVWHMSGQTLVSGTVIGNVSDLNWKVVAIGDFNGDGKSDILWRNVVTNQINLWQMNGDTVALQATVATLADGNWRLEAAGDVTGDGKDDLIWRHTVNGNVAVWEMNGATVQGAYAFANVADQNWRIEIVSDVNADGKADLIWRNAATGDTSVWLMSGHTVLNTAALWQQSDLNWQIQVAGDFYGDGKTELVWRNQQTGELAMWSLDGLTLTDASVFSAVPDLNWIIQLSKQSTGNAASIPSRTVSASTSAHSASLPLSGVPERGAVRELENRRWWSVGGSTPPPSIKSVNATNVWWTVPARPPVRWYYPRTEWREFLVGLRARGLPVGVAVATEFVKRLGGQVRAIWPGDPSHGKGPRLLLVLSDRMAAAIAKDPRVAFVVANEQSAARSMASVSNRLTPQTTMVTDAGYTLTFGPVGYDGSGNIAYSFLWGGGVQTWFFYDSVNRVRFAVTPWGGQTFHYDAFGNMTQVQTDDTTPWTWTIGQDPATGVTNRLAGADYTYDSAGNMTKYAGETQSWDGANMMTRFQSSSRDETYLYSADDERIATIDNLEHMTNWTFRGVDGQVLSDYKSSDADPVFRWNKDYIYRGTSPLAIVRATGDQTGQNPITTDYLLLDYLGSVRVITDGTGTEASYHDYLPFGTEGTDISQDAEAKRFTGHERDIHAPSDQASSNDYLDYMHARYYSANMGRFLSPDPVISAGAMRNPQMWNRYAYVGNSPINRTDPTGRLAADVIYSANAFDEIWTSFADSGNDGGEGGEEQPDPKPNEVKPEPAGGPPIPVPGTTDGEWKWNSNPENKRGGSYGPKKPIKGQSQPSGSWEGGAATPHWDIDDGKGGRRRYDEHGNYISPETAHGNPTTSSRFTWGDFAAATGVAIFSTAITVMSGGGATLQLQPVTGSIVIFHSMPTIPNPHDRCPYCI